MGSKMRRVVCSAFDITLCLFPDVDECEDSDVCGTVGTCNNTAGSYMCLCPSGYLLDGMSMLCQGKLC